MSKETKIRAETERWLTYARQDLTAAKALANQNESFPHQVCFLSQQAAEKGLKALLIFMQIEFPFRHDLEVLRTLIPEDCQCRQLTNLEQLTEWAVESRYPSDLPEPSQQDAQDALQQAESVLALVEQDLHQKGFEI